ncbi:MAG: hypothetical protein ABEN55_16375 [Bradymonadaceae bacterium]
MVVAAFVLTLGFVSVSATPTVAYERTKTCGDSYLNNPCGEGEIPKPLHWPRRCVMYRTNRRGSPSFPGQTGERLSDELQRLVVRALEQRNHPDCSDFKMVYGGRTRVDEAAYRKKKTNAPPRRYQRAVCELTGRKTTVGLRFPEAFQPDDSEGIRAAALGEGPVTRGCQCRATGSPSPFRWIAALLVVGLLDLYSMRYRRRRDSNR